MATSDIDVAATLSASRGPAVLRGLAGQRPTSGVTTRKSLFSMREQAYGDVG
ncbi:hypothetical protein [Xanthomonas albilineans]|uniref:hypothetical protein n=1 Tax=Xanthomonas albilineans TaxID=29447 RepID=UPI0018B063D6|nr:hypothetical protein [Xanthomonas albilineans]